MHYWKPEKIAAGNEPFSKKLKNDKEQKKLKFK